MTDILVTIGYDFGLNLRPLLGEENLTVLLVLVATLVMYALAIWMMIRILAKAGLSRVWVVLAFIPVVNIAMIWIFAFIRWPNTTFQDIN